MDIYHTWIYVNILNQEWFIWTIITMVFLLNFLAPIHIWLVMNSKSMPFLKKKKNRNKKADI